MTADRNDGAKIHPCILWWPAVAVVCLVGVCEWMLYLHFVRREDTTLQGVSLLASGLLTGILLTAWWVFFSRTGWKLRLGVLLLAAGLLAGVVRFEGFRGDMVPQVSFRWNPAIGTVAPSGGDSPPDSGTTKAFASYQMQPSDSPGYRGAERDGILFGALFNENWLKPELLWRVPVGAGWSGIAVVGPLTWTQEQRGDREAVVCRDALNGAEIWVHEDAVRFDEPMGGPGPRATPTIEGDRVYALGATGILNCLGAATGKLHWSVNILQDAGAENLEWAMSGSPLIYGDLVIVSPGGERGMSLVAYDRHSGGRRWSGGDAMASYASPQLSRLRGTEQVLVFGGRGIYAHGPKDGAVLWSHPWSAPTKINVAQPVVVGDGALFLSAGYTKGAILLDVDLGEDGWRVEERWRSTRLKAKFNSFILHKGHVYGLDEGILTCLDVTTGQRKWKEGRYGFGQLLLEPNGEVLVLQAESGEIVFVKATPIAHEEIGRFPALEGKTWNQPTIANGCLYTRNDRQAACFRLETSRSIASAGLE